MNDIYASIKIVPVKNCLSHEGIVQKWVDQIASNIKNDGVMKNPIIVTAHEGYYVVLDGMHRFAAFQQLELKDILVCEVDYFSSRVVLEGWDVFTFYPLDPLRLLGELFPQEEGYQHISLKDLKQAREMVLNRQSLLAIADRAGAIYALEVKKTGVASLLETLCEATDRLDRVMSERFSKSIYVDNSLTLENFLSSSAQAVVFRPQFTKQEVLDRTLNKKLFPPKSTRHLIPERPLRVDLDLSLLRSAIDLKTKNALLQEHLRWAYENNRVRFYPESVYIFSD